jgi:hypothetical protein
MRTATIQKRKRRRRRNSRNSKIKNMKRRTTAFHQIRQHHPRDPFPLIFSLAKR